MPAWSMAACSICRDSPCPPCASLVCWIKDSLNGYLGGTRFGARVKLYSPNLLLSLRSILIQPILGSLVYLIRNFISPHYSTQQQHGRSLRGPMSAIAGLWCFDGRPAAVEGCSRMLAAQKIYGPDGIGQWSDDSIALGRRLMRLLPEDAFDRQPLVGAAGRYILVADIRLDNRAELTSELGLSPDTSARLSDAALLLAVIERWGDNCFDHLVGDYAFALWDAEAHRMWLARDPLGQRPLHYHRGNGFFAFATMPKGLHALPEIPYAPNEAFVADFLTVMLEDGTQTFFSGIQRLQPGHVAMVSCQKFELRRHWIPKRRRIKLGGAEEYAEGLRPLLDQAVRARLRGAEDVGAYLSGGLDSSAVAATAARIQAAGGRKVIAFTAVPHRGYAGPNPRNRFIDEAGHAAETAALYSNMEHILIPNEGRSPLDDLDRSLLLLDQPAHNLCNMGWAYNIFDAAKARKLKVILAGSAGNFGISYNGLELLPELLRGGDWLRLLCAARALVAHGGMRWRGVLANTLGPWCPTGLWIWINKIAHGASPDVGEYSAIHPNYLAEMNIVRRARVQDIDLACRPSKDGFDMRLSALMARDPGAYNKGTLGGWQLDERDPTADVRILEYCLAVPTDQFLNDGVQRALARRALADRLPKRVIEERRKGLQAADWHEHLTAVRDRIGEEFDRLDACQTAGKLMNLSRLRRLVEDWPTVDWEHDRTNLIYRSGLLRAISAGHFLRKVSAVNS